MWFKKKRKTINVLLAILASQQVLNLMQTVFKWSLSLSKKCVILFFHISSCKAWSLRLNGEHKFEFPCTDSVCVQQASNGFSCKLLTRQRQTITLCLHCNFHLTSASYSSELAILITSTSKRESNHLVQTLNKVKNKSLCKTTFSTELNQNLDFSWTP